VRSKRGGDQLSTGHIFVQDCLMAENNISRSIRVSKMALAGCRWSGGVPTHLFIEKLEVLN
jgi:hypothetical protein